MGLFSKNKESKPSTPEKQTTTKIVIPLKGNYLFDQASFSKTYSAGGGGRLSVKELAGQEPGAKAFRLTEENEVVTLTIRNTPLPKKLVEESVHMARSSALPIELKDEEANEFLNSVGFITLESKISPSTGPVQSAFLSQLLTTMMKTNDLLIGYNVISAQTYKSRKWLLSTLETEEFDPGFMFIMLGNIHAVRDGEFWIHTHGMEQFGAPDIEVKFSDEGKRGYYMGLVGDSAMYVAGKGPVLKIGDTAELAGDGIIYRIVEGTKDEPGHFGSYGVIRITKK